MRRILTAGEGVAPDQIRDWSRRVFDLSRADRPELKFRTWGAAERWLELMPKLSHLFEISAPLEDVGKIERAGHLKVTVAGNPALRRGLRVTPRAGAGHMSTIRLAAFLLLVTIRAREEAG